MAAEAAAAAGGASWLGPAVIGAALIGGIGSAVAGNQAANEQKKAANQANAAALAAQRRAEQLNEPWRQSGVNALNQQNALLGIGGGSSGGGQYAQQPGSSNWAGYLEANPDVAAAYQQAIQTPNLRNMGIQSMEDWARYHYETVGRAEGRQLPQVAGPTGADGQPLTQSQITDGAYNTFLDSGFNRAMTDFTNNDLDMIRSRSGAAGTSISGSAVGAMGDRLARNRYTAFGDYSNALSGLSGTAANLSTSQGQNGMNTANQIGANNQNAAAARGSSYMNTANALNSGLQNTTNVLAYGSGQGWFGGSQGAAAAPTGTYNGINFGRALGR